MTGKTPSMTVNVEGEPEPSVLFVAWTRTVGRSHEIAAALAGEAFVTHPSALASRRLVLARYLVNAARTVTVLARRRPDVVIVTNPPVMAAVVVWAWTRATGTHFVLDSHPSSFGAKDHVISQRLIGLHRFLARRALACMVTTRDWVEVLQSWGARGVIVHEAPPLWSAQAAPSAADTVLFPGVFAGDEPIEQVVELARLRPDVEFRVTGDRAKCPPDIVADLPPNLQLVGYLGPDDYAAEVARAGTVLALTTEPTSIMRAAYEAVYARRPLVVSDWPAGREAFPAAIHVVNRAEDLARGVDEALKTRDDAVHLDAAFEEQGDRWTQQLRNLRIAISQRPRSAGTRRPWRRPA
jgi:hypothetical protein